MATDWSPSPKDPASGVKTSSVEVNSNGIYMDTTGEFSSNAAVAYNVRGGSGANFIGISNNETNNHFLWAGNQNPSLAPFAVTKDGKIRATKIQQEYAQSFWDMADASFPAEFLLHSSGTTTTAWSSPSDKEGADVCQERIIHDCCILYTGFIFLRNWKRVTNRPA